MYREIGGNIGPQDHRACTHSPRGDAADGIRRCCLLDAGASVLRTRYNLIRIPPLAGKSRRRAKQMLSERHVSGTRASTVLFSQREPQPILSLSVTLLLRDLLCKFPSTISDYQLWSFVVGSHDEICGSQASSCV